MASLFGSKLQDICFADIEQFCDQKIPENISLEYKRDLSSKDANEQVSKIACALANSYGGLVLWGISEKKQSDGRGVPDVLTGLSISPSPADKLKKICMECIQPPLFVEVLDISHDTDKSKVCTIMRVTESDNTPHYLRADGCVYVRSDDISKPINNGRIATPDEIEWLQRRREKPTQLRTELLHTAETRSRFIAGDCYINSMSLSMLPLYPRNPLLSLQKLLELHTTVDASLPRQTANHSVLSFDLGGMTGSRKSWKYFEMNEFGLLYSASDAREFTNSEMSINMIALLNRMVAMGSYAHGVYETADYLGLVQVEAKIQGVRGYGLTSHALGEPQLQRMIDDTVTLRSIISASQLCESSWMKILHERFLWSLGCGVTQFLNDDVNADYDYVMKQYGNNPKILACTG